MADTAPPPADDRPVDARHTHADSAEHASVDWRAWHDGYDNPNSALQRRLALVQSQLRAALDRSPARPISLISICAGQAHDAIGVLAEHPRSRDVSALLVELDADNVRIAQRAAAQLRLDNVRSVVGDASVSDAYAAAVPADIVLVCGVFGNISAEHAANTIEHLRELCAPHATVIWTRHRHAPDLVPHIRHTFQRAGFGELAFADAPPFGVGANRLLADPLPFREDVKLFEFVGHRALWPHLDGAQRTALRALFRTDCSISELVAAMRALPFGLPTQNSAESMLSEGRGTSATKHLFLAHVLAQRFPHTQPQLVHRVHTLQPQLARELFGEHVAAAVPNGGLVDVHRYLLAVIDGRRVALDVTVSGPAWDGHSSLALACAPGQDIPAGANPDADMRALEHEHCDAHARAPFVAALRRAGAPAAHNPSQANP